MPRNPAKGRTRTRRNALQCVRLIGQLRRERRRLGLPSLPHQVVAGVQHTQETDRLCQLPPALTQQEMAAVERWATRHREHPGWVKPRPVEDFAPTIQALRGAADVLDEATVPDMAEKTDGQANHCYTHSYWRQKAAEVIRRLVHPWRWGS